MRLAPNIKTVLFDNPVDTLTQPANTSCQSLRSSAVVAVELLIDESCVAGGEHGVVAAAGRRKCVVIVGNSGTIAMDTDSSSNIVSARRGRSTPHFNSVIPSFWQSLLRIGVSALLHYGVRAALRRVPACATSPRLADWLAVLLTVLTMAIWPLSWSLALLRVAWLALITADAAAASELLLGVSRAVFVRNMHDWLDDSDAFLDGVSRWLGGRAIMRGAAFALVLGIGAAFVRAVWLESHATPLLGAWLLVGIVLPLLLATAASLTTRLRARKAATDGIVLATYVAGVAYFSLAALHKAPLGCALQASALWWGDVWPASGTLLLRALPPLATVVVVCALLASHALANDIALDELLPVFLTVAVLAPTGELLHLCTAESADAALWRIASQLFGVTAYYVWRVWGGGADEVDDDDLTPHFDDDEDE
jgi:hypothetical protein